MARSAGLRLTIFYPLFGAGRLNQDFSTAESLNPGLKTVEQWAGLKTATWSAFAGFALVSFYGGWGLARSVRWFAVRRAIAALWIGGPLSHVVLGWVVPIVTLRSIEGFKANDTIAPLMLSLSRSVLAATLWTAYLLRSRRVRNTYQDT